jgi:VWFA-related protein
MTIALLFITQVTIPAQTTNQQKPLSSEEIVRINSELVQTDVMVFDKHGHFVVDLPRDDFQLTLDGKPQPISFFERIQTGLSQTQKAVTTQTSATVVDSSNPAARTGRVIFFFLDDIHLGNASLTRARQALNEFIEKRMLDDDQVAIVSTSGQIGFLQQLSDNEVVLKEAVSRLNDKRVSENYAGRTIITEYEANRVGEHSDKNLFNYLVSSTINEYQLRPVKGGDPRGLDKLAVNNVKNRVGQINAQSRVATGDTLSVLMSLMHSSLPLPGRKLLFFLSDGFITDSTASGAMATLKQVTEMAARTGIVVYSMDVRGTHSEPQVDAGRNDFPDGMGSGNSARMPSNEAFAMQEPLRILADDTGGRAVINSNSIPDSIDDALKETSSYYLLAWRPENEEQRSAKAKLKVTLRNHPDLRVRLRRNYYVPANRQDLRKTEPDAVQPAQTTRDLELVSSLGSLYPQRTLPLTLSTGYQANTPATTTLLLSMQLDRRALGLDETKTGDKNEVDVIGAAIDDRGVIVSFKQVLTVIANPDPNQQNVPVQWSQSLSVPPGLYQVRVAVREREHGYTGSGQQWIVVPNLSTGETQMSSLFVAEPKTGSSAAKPKINVARHFARGSTLRYQVYLYNFKATQAGIDIQTSILTNGRIVMELPKARASSNNQTTNTIPYWTELPLSRLGPGTYKLQVTAFDTSSPRSVSQHLTFVID